MFSSSYALPSSTCNFVCLFLLILFVCTLNHNPGVPYGIVFINTPVFVTDMVLLRIRFLSHCFILNEE